ncbi:hypothetical protein GBAR_LOCUS15583, partial [Geodia barretti]
MNYELLQQHNITMQALRLLTFLSTCWNILIFRYTPVPLPKKMKIIPSFSISQKQSRKALTLMATK